MGEISGIVGREVGGPRRDPADERVRCGRCGEVCCDGRRGGETASGGEGKLRLWNWREVGVAGSGINAIGSVNEDES